jgi:hypothetical protein
MRKKMLLLAFALTATVVSLAPRADASGLHSCPICTTYSDGSQCCVPCVCDDKGHVQACTNVYCPPEGGID